MHLHIDTHWDAAGARGEEAVKRHANEAGADSNSQVYSAGVIGNAGSETLACVSDISRWVKATKSPLCQNLIYKSWFIVKILRVSRRTLGNNFCVRLSFTLPVVAACHAMQDVGGDQPTARWLDRPSSSFLCLREDLRRVICAYALDWPAGRLRTEEAGCPIGTS
jgi:hypothetical protein